MRTQIEKSKKGKAFEEFKGYPDEKGGSDKIEIKKIYGFSLFV